jgi:sugar O-acyltransferase (sialic acid O-acetyltransferase NeuD family)
MKKRYIFGSGGFAKEVFFLLEEKYKANISFFGFIDISDSKKFVQIGTKNYPIIKESAFEMMFSQNNEEVELYIGIASPEIIKNIATKFHNFIFPNLIHNNFIGQLFSINMGEGNIITAGCIFTCCINLGSFNIFNTNTAIGHDCIIGSCNVFLPRTQISGFVQIGNNNLFGMNSSVLQGKKIGNQNKIGAYSFVITNVKDNSNLFGIPATKLQF